MKKYEVKPSKFFLKQLEKLNLKTIKIIYEKLRLLEINPKRNKSLEHQKYNLLRIRISDINREIRIVYSITGSCVKVLFILDRSKNYKDLEKLIKILEKEEFL